MGDAADLGHTTAMLDHEATIQPALLTSELLDRISRHLNPRLALEVLGHADRSERS